MIQPFKFLHRVGKNFTRKQMLWVSVIIAGIAVIGMLFSY